MQLTNGSFHYKTMSAINLHRWPISKTTEINTETQELILKYTDCLISISKLHINPPGGAGVCSFLNEQNRTARKQEDWKNDYLHSALNTSIK